MFKSISKITLATALTVVFIVPFGYAAEVDQANAAASLRQVLVNNSNVSELLPIGSKITRLTTKSNSLFNMSGRLMNNEFFKEAPALCKTEWQILSPVVDLMSDKITNEWRTVMANELAKNLGIIQEHTEVNARGQEYHIFGSRCKDMFVWNSQYTVLNDIKYLSRTVFITHLQPQEYILKSKSLKPPVEPADGVVPEEHFGQAYPFYIEMLSWAVTLCENKNGKLTMYPIGDYRASVITSIDEMTTKSPNEYFLGCTTHNQIDSFLVKSYTEHKVNIFNGNPIEFRKIAYQHGRTLESVLSGK